VKAKTMWYVVNQSIKEKPKDFQDLK
jgi:hypothetical protein